MEQVVSFALYCPNFRKVSVMVLDSFLKRKSKTTILKGKTYAESRIFKNEMIRRQFNTFDLLIFGQQVNEPKKNQQESFQMV